MTERLTLRRFVDSDADSLVELDSDPKVMRYLSGGAATPREAIESGILPRFMASCGKFDGLGYWAALARGDGEFLGWFGLHPADDRPVGDLELGYRLRRAAWGLGYATEGGRALIDVGFGRYGATRVFAQTYEDNLASRRVMEKFGMTFVRSFRVSAEELAGGTFVSTSAPFEGDDVEYAIERREWERRRAIP